MHARAARQSFDPFRAQRHDSSFDGDATVMGEVGRHDAAFVEELDPVERYMLRRGAVGRGNEALDRLADEALETAAALERLGGVAPADRSLCKTLCWRPDVRADLRVELATRLRQARLDGDDVSSVVLARWRAGDLSADALHEAALLRLESWQRPGWMPSEDPRVVTGPWSLEAPPLDLVYDIHVVLLALRHADLQLTGDLADTLELWLGELRNDLRARCRSTELPSGDEIAEYLAAASEMWRDTAPFAKPIRVPLERLTRLVWSASMRRPTTHVENAGLLIVGSNLRLDDLDRERFELALLSAQDRDGSWDDRALDDRSETAGADASGDEAGDSPWSRLAVNALALRALSGPRRTGPPR